MTMTPAQKASAARKAHALITSARRIREFTGPRKHPQDVLINASAIGTKANAALRELDGSDTRRAEELRRSAVALLRSAAVMFEGITDPAWVPGAQARLAQLRERPYAAQYLEEIDLRY